MSIACLHILGEEKVCFFWKRNGNFLNVSMWGLVLRPRYVTPCQVLTPRVLSVHIVALSLNRSVPNPLRRRFFRARKYNVEEAYKMFNAVCLAREKDRHCVFYDNIDIDLFDETRNIVRLPLNMLLDPLNICSSTLTGQAIETYVASLFTTLTWKPSPPQPWPLIRKVPNPCHCQI